MKRIGFILVLCTLLTANGLAASRSTPVSKTSLRNGTTTQQTRTNASTPRKTARSAISQNTITPRTQQQTSKSVSARVTKTTATNNRATTRNNNINNVVARAATTETQTGAEYENCKTTYFACMDQFCQLKNDEYRRCSCSDRIQSLQNARNNLQQASEQLTAFNENLEIVGKTAAQAAAMNTASDGEMTLTKDNSASKALLTAIMNSIRGTDSRVENSKLSDLNSIDLSFDAANSFGTSDIGQIIASYNGVALYSAVYPQCRDAVKSTCNTASLQRAVNAYLMAIEQDCNTVQTAITNKQKATHAAIRESSSMLDMARAENHKSHNSDDIATCLANVESAILSEEVCGSNYHKCLDNGEYIDVSTGAPIAGVVDFYKLGQLLTFASGRSNADQKLAQNPNNKAFVSAFEKRVKQFAEPALDKCYDDADDVWTDYLNKALLDIYYAQQSKVEEIKQGCFDFVSACYMNGSTAMTNAMQGLVAAQTTVLNPNILVLNKSLCSDYISSCNNMFDGQIVANYIENRHDTDSLTACRAVVKQCFDNYGGQNYENFYNPSSGLFASGEAPNWFALYECDNDNCTNKTYKSECAKQLAAIDACSNLVEQAFGGFNYYPNHSNIYTKYEIDGESRLTRASGIATEIYNQIIDTLQTNCTNLDGKFVTIQNLKLTSNDYSKSNFCEATFHNDNSRYKSLFTSYSIGKSYTQYSFPFPSFSQQGIIGGDDFIDDRQYNYKTTDIYENMCPRDYNQNTDVSSWGACLCWENGGRRSNNGTSTRCVASFPVKPLVAYEYEINVINTEEATISLQQQTVHGLNNSCNAAFKTDTEYSDEKNGHMVIWPYSIGSTSNVPTDQDWCTAAVDKNNKVCPFGHNVKSDGECNECEYDTQITTLDDNPTTTKCCPKDYTLKKKNNSTTYYCCPEEYDNFDTTSNKCFMNEEDFTSADQGIDPVKATNPTEMSGIMDKIPSGNQ